MPVRGRSPREALEAALKPFLKDHPGVSVRLWVVPWGTVWDRLMSVLKGRPGPDAPDVLQIDPAWTGTLAALGLLGEVEPDPGASLPLLEVPCRWPAGQRFFSSPWTMDVRLPHVSSEALARAGLSGTDLGEPEGWRALLARGIRPRLSRSPAVWDGESLLAALAPWVWSAGGDFLSPDGQAALFLSPEALGAAAFARTFLLDGPAAGVRSLPLGSPREKGTSVFVPPRGAGGRFVHVTGGALAVAAETRHPLESRSLLRHLTSIDVQKEMTRALGLLPARLAEAESSLDRPGRELLSESLSMARALPPATWGGSFERLFQRHLAPLVRDAAPWDDWRTALEGAARETNRLLSAHHAPGPSPVAAKKSRDRQLPLLERNR